MNRDHIHHYSRDNRKAEIYYNKTNKCFEVEMYENQELIQTVPMVTNGVTHSERYAEDAAENWVDVMYQSRG